MVGGIQGRGRDLGPLPSRPIACQLTLLGRHQKPLVLTGGGGRECPSPTLGDSRGSLPELQRDRDPWALEPRTALHPPVHPHLPPATLHCDLSALCHLL